MDARWSIAAALLACAGARAAPAEAAPQPGEPAVQRSVAEDDNVRIEELRVRGQTQSITVKSKVRGFRGTQYDVVPATGARDPSQAGSAVGQRVWHLFSF